MNPQYHSPAATTPALSVCPLQLPRTWAAAAYPSSKSLGGWMADLVKRVSFMRQWLSTGQPDVFWLPGG